MSIAPLSRLSNVNWLNSHNKHCNSMMIGNYSTLLIGDFIIAGLKYLFQILEWRILIFGRDTLNRYML